VNPSRLLAILLLGVSACAADQPDFQIRGLVTVEERSGPITSFFHKAVIVAVGDPTIVTRQYTVLLRAITDAASAPDTSYHVVRLTGGAAEISIHAGTWVPSPGLDVLGVGDSVARPMEFEIIGFSDHTDGAAASGGTLRVAALATRVTTDEGVSEYEHTGTLAIVGDAGDAVADGVPLLATVTLRRAGGGPMIFDSNATDSDLTRLLTQHASESWMGDSSSTEVVVVDGIGRFSVRGSTVGMEARLMGWVPESVSATVSKEVLLRPTKSVAVRTAGWPGR